MSNESNTQPEPDESAGPSSSRRDFVKRSVVAGGVIWAAPSVLSMGSKAFATVGSGTGGQEECDDYFKFKYDSDGFTCPPGDLTSDTDDGDAVVGFPDCGAPDQWNDLDAVCVEADGAIPGVIGTIVVEEYVVNDETGQTGLRFTLPSGCEIVTVSVKAGSSRSNSPDGGTEETGNVECSDTPASVFGNVFEVELPTKDVSYVGAVICCQSVHVAG